jgi:hypothetical protein
MKAIQDYKPLIKLDGEISLIEVGSYGKRMSDGSFFRLGEIPKDHCSDPTPYPSLKDGKYFYDMEWETWTFGDDSPLPSSYILYDVKNICHQYIKNGADLLKKRFPLNTMNETWEQTFASENLSIITEAIVATGTFQHILRTSSQYGETTISTTTTKEKTFIMAVQGVTFSNGWCGSVHMEDL